MAPAISTSPAVPATTDGQARPVAHARTVRPPLRQADVPAARRGITTAPATWAVRRRAPATRVMPPHRIPVTVRQTQVTATNTPLPTAVAATQAATAPTNQAIQTTNQIPRAHAATTLQIHPTPAALTVTQVQAATVRRAALTEVAVATAVVEAAQEAAVATAVAEEVAANLRLICPGSFSERRAFCFQLNRQNL